MKTRFALGLVWTLHYTHFPYKEIHSLEPYHNINSIDGILSYWYIWIRGSIKQKSHKSRRLPSRTSLQNEISNNNRIQKYLWEILMPLFPFLEKLIWNLNGNLKCYHGKFFWQRTACSFFINTSPVWDKLFLLGGRGQIGGNNRQFSYCSTLKSNLTSSGCESRQFIFKSLMNFIRISKILFPNLKSWLV